MAKNKNNNSEQNNAVEKDMNQLLLELRWMNRHLLASWFALYGTILVSILRMAHIIAKLDEINKTNFAKNTVIAGIVVKDILDTFPRIIDEIFLVLSINSTEQSFENLVNLNYLNNVTNTEIVNSQKALQASFFAYLAAKLGYEIDVGTQIF